MKRIIALLMIMLISISAIGCKQKGPDDPTVVTTTDPTTEPTKTPDITEIPVTESPSVTETPDITETPAPTAAPGPADHPTVSIDDVLGAYRDFMSEYLDNDTENFSTARFYLGFVDADDIPELFIELNPDYDTPVEVYGYLDGKVISAGSFGAGGSFSFLEKQNIISSTYSSSSEYRISIYEIGSDGKAFLTDELIQIYEPDENSVYYINGLISDMDSFYAAFKEAYPYEGYKDVTFSLAQSQCYKAFLLTDKDSILNTMYETIKSGEDFYCILHDDFDKISGSWDIDNYTVVNRTDGTVTDHDSNLRGYVSITEGPDVFYRFYDLWSDDDFVIESTQNSLTYLDYPMYDRAPSDHCYHVAGLYGEADCFFTYYTDSEDTEWLEFYIKDSKYTDNDYHLRFQREYLPSGIDLTGYLVPSPENDTDEYYAFTFNEYLFLNGMASDEILAEYGLTGLDSYDYEIVKKHDAPADRIIYGHKTASKKDRSTYYTYLDNSIQSQIASADEFIDSFIWTDETSSFTITTNKFVRVWFDTEDTDIASAIIQEYIP